MLFSKDAIRTAFLSDLPGIPAHDVLMNYERPSVEEVLNSDRKVRESAVTFLLYPEGQEWYFVLLKRHDYSGAHSGQVGLPGGSLDLGETEMEAAQRELHEETGILLSESAFLSRLTPLYIPPSNFIVQPFAALLDETPAWHFDEREVKKALHVPLQELLAPDNVQDEKVLINGGLSRLNVKCFRFHDEVVWGATAMILSECKQILSNLAP
jgi:8-oxo-dGTP pyrophosphatase MutT (NUDIX family)